MSRTLLVWSPVPPKGCDSIWIGTPNPGLFPFCLLQFCTSILSTYLLFIPKGSQASFRSGVLLIDLLHPADLRFSSYSGLVSLAQFRPPVGCVVSRLSGQNRLNGFFGD
jgi:hypothetical protein